mmetsp:Transcript_4957/g.6410  ORF Transcript_4957/g.6410 Transcript_4957/m.6410 type:complete len:674 (+) Transcript_4957:86-2107(+)
MTSKIIPKPSELISSVLEVESDNAEDIGGGTRKLAHVRSLARKNQAKLITDAEILATTGFIQLPAAVNLSFILDNVGGAVKDRHIKKNKHIPNYISPKAALFDWVWNEPEMPSLVTLGSWWICALLSQSKVPIGPLSNHSLHILKKAEEESLKGISKLFSTILKHHSENIKFHGGGVAERASHIVWSSILPDALARATRDACSLTWPHLRSFLELSESCVTLVGMWSYLLTGDKGPHVFAKNIAKSKVKSWGIPTDLAPAQLHLRRAEADQPSSFPALDRRRQRERAIRDRISTIQDNAKIMALPFHERERIEKTKQCSPTTCEYGIPLITTDTTDTTDSSGGGVSKRPTMKHGRFVFGKSPLIQLALSSTPNVEIKETMRLFGKEIVSTLTNCEKKSPPSEGPPDSDSNNNAIRNEASPSEYNTPVKSPLKLHINSPLEEEDNGSESIASSESIRSQKAQLEGEGKAEARKKRGTGQLKKRETPKRGDSVVSITFAPSIYEVDALLQQFSNPTKNKSEEDNNTELNTELNTESSPLYTSLLHKSAIKGLGEPTTLATPVVTHQWAPDAMQNLKPLKEMGKNRIQIKTTEELNDRLANRAARGEVLSLEKERCDILDSKLDVRDHARRTLEHALESSKAPVSMLQVRRVRDYHTARGTLPRHHAVRLESFSKK